MPNPYPYLFAGRTQQSENFRSGLFGFSAFFRTSGTVPILTALRVYLRLLRLVLRAAQSQYLAVRQRRTGSPAGPNRPSGVMERLPQ